MIANNRNLADRCSRAMRLLFLVVAAVLGALFLGAPSTRADLTDTRTAWSNFEILPVTHLGSQISDYESSSDPTNGGAAVAPASIDLASASPYPNNPGEAPTSLIGYYDGGTTWDPNDPATMNDDYIMFRMRVDDDPTKNTGFKQYHWNIVLDVDGDGYKEFWVDLNGPHAANGDDELHVLYNNDNTQLMPDRAKNPEIIRDRFVARNDEDAPGLSHTRAMAVGDGSGDWWIDIQVPMTAFTDLNGNQVVFPDMPLIPYFSTSASNTDPLQKDWFKVLQAGASYDPNNPIAADDPIVPDGTPYTYFTDEFIMEDVDYYWVGDNLYVTVVHADANTDPNVNETITVTVTNPATGDLETVTLTATSPEGSIFSNQGGASDPVSTAPTEGWISDVFTSMNTVDETWTITYDSVTGTHTVVGSVSGPQANPIVPGVEYESDNGEIRFTTLWENGNPASYTITFDTYAADPLTCSSVVGSNDDGDLQVNPGDRIYTTYTYAGEDYMDYADIYGPGEPVIQFTWADGTPTGSYQLNPDPGLSDELFVTVTHADANTDPNTVETITVSLASATDSEASITLTETGPDTGIFRNTSGLTSQVFDGASVPDDGLWEDIDAAVVTATYDYLGTPYTSEAALFYTAGGGVVNFSNGGGTQDVDSYFLDDPVWIKVDDPNRADPSFDVTVTSDVTGDSETITVYETFSGSGVYMNLNTDLQTTAGSGVVTSPSSTFITDGVQVGDRFDIATGPDAGSYIVQSVDSETQITLTTTLTTTRDTSNPVRFSANPLVSQTYTGVEPLVDDDVLYAVHEEQLTVSYLDNDDGDSDPSNDIKTDIAYYYDQPTAVMLSSFRAYSDGGQVVVEWETSAECGTVGFHLLRRDRKTKRYQRVDDEMLPALVTSPQGGVYRLTDAGASAGTRLTYKLVEIESSGNKRSYGPFHVKADGSSAVVSGGKRGKFRRAKYERRARKPSKAKKDRSGEKGRRGKVRRGPKLPKGLKGQAAAKIAVLETGLYYVGADEIASVFGCTAEEAVGAIGRNRLRLSCRGKRVPYTPADGDTGLYFFGESIDSQYTKENIYWLGVKNGDKRPVLRGRGPSAVGPGAMFTDTVHLEKDVLPATGFFTDPEADFWVWDYVFGGFASMDTKAYTIRAEGVAQTSEKATLTVRLQGGSDADVDPDHHAVISVNGTPVGEVQWNGTEGCVRDLKFAQSLLVSGDNQITVKGLLDTGAPYSLFYVDSFDLTYQRLYQAANDSLLCRSGRNRVLSISGFTTPDVVVLEIRDRTKVKRITGLTVDQEGASYRVSFRSVPKDVAYLATAKSAAKPPAYIVADEPSSLKDRKTQAEFVIIAPEELKDAAQGLAAYRQGQGLSAMVVGLQDIYDEFNHGIANPNAIKSFLSHAHGKWRVGPRYVLLAGEGTFDYKDVQGYGDNLIPPLLVGTRFGLFVSDIAYADVTGGDGVPEMAIGRLPVRNAVELGVMINKIASYEGASGAWKNRVMMLADYDDPDAGAFRANSDMLARLVRDPYTVQKVYLNETPPATARNMVRSGFQEGRYLVNYMGHSLMNALSKAGLLSTNDVKYMSNGDRLPIVTTLTCLTGRHGLPGYDSLGEELVLKDGGGAIAFWGPSSLCFNGDSKALGRGFFKAVFQDGQSVLGGAVVSAMRDLAASGSLPATSQTYNLLGDPALRIKDAGGGGSVPVTADAAPAPENAAGRPAAPPQKPPPQDKGAEQTAAAPASNETAAPEDAPASGGGSVLPPAEETVAPGVALVEDTGNTLTLEVRPPSPLRSGGRLAIPGYGSTDSPGDPLLPKGGFVVPIPQGMSVSAVVLETETEAIEDIDIPPAPRYVLQDVSGGKSRLAEGGEWSRVPVAVDRSPIYSRDGDWPDPIVRADAGGQMGPAHLAIVTVTPVTYNGVARRATFHKVIRVRLDLHPDAKGKPTEIDAEGWRPPGARAAKFRTRAAGILRVSLTSLQRAALGASRPDQLAVFHRGVRVPVCVRGDGIDFLATRNAEVWGREAVYWITTSAEPGPRMAEVDATPPKDGPAAGVGPQKASLDDVAQLVFVGDNLPLEDRFILAEIGPGRQQTFALSVTGPDRKAGSEVRVVAVNAVDASKGSVSVNGARTESGLEAWVAPGKIVDGENEITVTNGSANALLVKRIEVSVLPDVRAAKSGMRVPVARSGVLTLGGLASREVDIYDVTPDAPALLTGVEWVQDGAVWIARFAATAGHVYEMVDAARAGTGRIELDRPSDLYAGRHGADYVIITHRQFERAARRLALHRASQGRRVEVVDIEDVFDEFAFGEADPDALRRFLAHACRRGSPRVRQVVLLGDGGIASGFIPTHVELVGRVATVSDSWFGCMDGSDRLADMEIGRLPVRTVAEAEGVVYKLVHYDFSSAEASWARRMFEVGGEVDPKSRRVSSTLITSRTEMTRALRSGGLLLTLLGPGRLDRAGGDVLEAGAARHKDRGDGHALMISAESLHGYYASPSVRSLAEDLMCGRGGAIGAIVNTGLMTGEDARLVTESIVQTALGSDVRGLGALLDVGRLALAGQDEFEAGLRTSLLFGDPATVLKVPPVPEPRSQAGARSKAGPEAAPEPGPRSPYALIWEVLSPGAGRGGPKAKSGAGELDIVLKATMVDGGRPYAIIQFGSGRQRLVKVGDRIGGAEVVGIKPRSVVLDVKGQRVKIRIRPR